MHHFDAEAGATLFKKKTSGSTSGRKKQMHLLHEEARYILRTEATRHYGINPSIDIGWNAYWKRSVRDDLLPS